MEGDKEKYTKALDRARNIYGASENKDILSTLSTIFPELKESDDERIRKEIISYLKGCYGAGSEDHLISKRKEWIAWIEEQGEHANFRNKIQIGDKVTRNEDGVLVNLSQLNRVAEPAEKQRKKKPTDKAQPKFKVGDWIVWQDKCYKVNYNGCGYEFIDQNGLRTSLEYGTVDESAHLWTIQDAKDGDVLAFDNGTIVIFKDLYNATTFHSYCHIENDIFNISKDDIPDWWEGKRSHPATKEQRDLLFTKIKEAGYEWDAEKKELKKIEQKPDWNEEDERIRYAVCDTLDRIDEHIMKYNRQLTHQQVKDWLKSIKERMKGECISVTDEELAQAKKDAYNDALDKIEYHSGEPTFDDGWSAAIWYLKKKNTQPQNTWKPSDEQMDVLLSEVTAWTKGCHKQIVLESLYNDLKKLKG